MFYPGSRYEKTGTYILRKQDGTEVSATKLPLPVMGQLAGFHRRHEGQRLDLIASYYLKDATRFWQLCDANNEMSPDALSAHELIGIPQKAR
ncbi:MAG: hypothetical protein QOE33_3470 [Acidobacteriota bacterium]|nr:hypothetical protein [Acidobacteriota bacterium]